MTAGLLITWLVGICIYFKVVMDWVFEADIVVSAAILIAALEGVSTIAIGGLHAVQLLNYDWSNGSKAAGFRSAVEKTFLALIATLLFDVVCARLIIFALSEDLSHEIQNFCRSGCFIHGTILRFSAIVAVPLMVNYAIILVLTYKRS